MRKEIIPSPHRLYEANNDEMNLSFNNYVEMPIDELPQVIGSFLANFREETVTNSIIDSRDHSEVTTRMNEPEAVKIVHSEALEVNRQIDIRREKVNGKHNEALGYNAVYDEMYLARERSRRGYNAAYARWGNKNSNLISEPWKYPEGKKITIVQRIGKFYDKFKLNLPWLKKRVYQSLTAATLLGLSLIGSEGQGVVAVDELETGGIEPRIGEIFIPESPESRDHVKSPISVLTTSDVTSADDLNQILVEKNSLREELEFNIPRIQLWGVEGASRVDASSILINSEMISLEQRDAGAGVPNELGKASIVSNLENTVIAAHNYLSGSEFLTMENGDPMIMSLKDGSEMTFRVREIVELRSYVATNESGALYYTHFEDSEGQYLSVQDVLDEYYNNDDFSGSVFLQACISRDGNSYWKIRIVRLTPQAMEFADKNLEALITEEVVESMRLDEVANLPPFIE